MDFTLKTYKNLLDALIKLDHKFITFEEYLKKDENKFIILRHDVEARYNNSLEFANLQYKNNIKGSYYFRIIPGHFDETVIRKIYELGHEVGYHYDDLSFCNGDFKKAINRFKDNLIRLRNIAEISTICMEGAPLSKFDNRELWKKYNFRDFGIIGEPYLDLNFHSVLYLTDTGRRWDGKLSVRDKFNNDVDSNEVKSTFFHNRKIKSTNDLINAILNEKLPDKVMITFHPQRWNSHIVPWVKELVFQNIKNQIKRYYITHT
jgi:hypothetical protein